MRHCPECGRRMWSGTAACWHCARRREADARAATRVSDRALWSVENRDAHIEALRKPLVPAPAVLRTVQLGQRVYDVVWDGSIR